MPAGAVQTVSGIQGNAISDDAGSRTAFDQFENLVLGATLVGDAAPVVATSWVLFRDTDLQNAEHGRIWRRHDFEGRQTNHLRQSLDAEGVALVEKYLSFDDATQRKFALPLERLNLARRRNNPGDMAIDGSICLEALLCSDGAPEIGYRLSLRAALLLGTSIAERRALKKSVKDFYGIRSKVLHGTRSNPNEAAKRETLAKEGLSICHRLLLRCIQLGSLPDMEELELQQGEGGEQSLVSNAQV